MLFTNVFKNFQLYLASPYYLQSLLMVQDLFCLTQAFV